MANRKRRSLEELYKLTGNLSKPKITPILQGNYHMQGPVYDSDNGIEINKIQSLWCSTAWRRHAEFSDFENSKRSSLLLRGSYWTHLFINIRIICCLVFFLNLNVKIRSNFRRISSLNQSSLMINTLNLEPKVDFWGRPSSRFQWSCCFSWSLNSRSGQFRKFSPRSRCCQGLEHGFNSIIGDALMDLEFLKGFVVLILFHKN